MYTDLIFFIPSSYVFSKKMVENRSIKKLPPKTENRIWIKFNT